MTPDTLEALRSYRRDVVKGIGLGAGLAAIGGTAAAQEDGDGGGGTATPTPDGQEDGTGGTGSVHTVAMQIDTPSTNPQRPADFFFQPTGLHVQPRDVIRFVATTPDHNVVSYHPSFGMRRRVPFGVDAFSSPILGWRGVSIGGDQVEPPGELEGGEAGGPEGGTETGNGSGRSPVARPADGAPVPETWLHAFDTPGVYDLLCSPHETFGMAMRVVVGDETDAPFETSNPDALAEPRAGPVGLARLTLTDPALAPEAIVEAGTVTWAELEANQVSGTSTPGGTPTDGEPTETGTATENETTTEG